VGRSVSTTILAVIVAAVVAAFVAGGVSYYISSHRLAVTTTVYKTVTQASSAGTSSTSCAVNVLTYIANLQQIEVPAGGTYEYTFPVQYPGYIAVTIFNSSTYDTYVEISGVAVNGTSYSSGQVFMGESGAMRYNVPPGTVHIYIENGDLTSEASVTLTIYYNSC